MSTPRAASPAPLEQLLLQLGTDKMPHSGRTLYEHLCGVANILSAWHQPDFLINAGMFHSIYSTERYERATLTLSERDRLTELIGDRAEWLVYLFCALHRADLFNSARAALQLGHADLPIIWHSGTLRVSSEEILSLVLLHLANRLEQSTNPDTRIGYWLSFMSDRIASLETLSQELPEILKSLGTISLEDERRLQALYLGALKMLQDGELSTAISQLHQVCIAHGYVAEPFLLLAAAHRLSGDIESARRAAARGITLLQRWGAPWHRSLSLAEWHAFSKAVRDDSTPLSSINEVIEAIATPEKPKNASRVMAQRMDVSRFFSYLSNARNRQSKHAIKWYPGITRTPWHDPQQFSVVRALEARFEEIKAEAMRVRLAAYFEESEGIERTGSWQVCMLFEQGRRHESLCEQCPITVSILDTHPDVRRSAGLIYLSRMTPHTHVAAHQGGSNMRLRCQLAISIPQGDCGIRVGDQERRWEEGKCIVFDDTFVHEVWNRTDQDRIVLIVDLWNPQLTSLEREALEAINWLEVTRAESIAKTWRRNELARQQANPLDPSRCADGFPLASAPDATQVPTSADIAHTMKSATVGDFIAEAVTPYVSGELISAEALVHIQTIARLLPGAMTDFFGFECSLARQSPTADFLVCCRPQCGAQEVLAAKRANGDLWSSFEGDPIWARIRKTSEEWVNPASPLHRHVHNLWLEFDFEHGIAPLPTPNVFFGASGLARSTAGPLSATSADRDPFWLKDLALPLLLGSPLDATVSQGLSRAIDLLPPEAHIFQVGVMLARPLQGVRICVRNLSRKRMIDYLVGLHWEGERSELEELLNLLAQRVERIDLDLDIVDRALPCIGLECYLSKSQYQLPRFLEFLASRELCTPQKAEAIKAWPGRVLSSLPSAHPRPATLVDATERDPDRMMGFKRGFHHAKIVYQSGSPVRAKAYLGVHLKSSMTGRTPNAAW
jgi:aspartyl/asparaginyl beta-hydroxylase (cupin superfamily)